MVQDVASVVSSERGGIGQVEADIAHNAAAAAAAKLTEAVVIQEKQVAAGKEALAKTALAGSGEGRPLARRAHDASTALGNKEEMGIAGNLALHASGAGGILEAASTVIDFMKDRRDPFKSTIPGAETFDAKIHSAVARADAKPRAISTPHSFNVASRANLATNALTGDTGNTGTWGGVGQTTATLTKKLENSLTKSRDKELNNSLKIKQDLVAKAGGLMMKGMGQTAAYRHASIASPKGPTHIGVEEGTGDVA